MSPAQTRRREILDHFLIDLGGPAAPTNIHPLLSSAARAADDLASLAHRKPRRQGLGRLDDLPQHIGRHFKHLLTTDINWLHARWLDVPMSSQVSTGVVTIAFNMMSQAASAPRSDLTSLPTVAACRESSERPSSFSSSVPTRCARYRNGYNTRATPSLLTR